MAQFRRFLSRRWLFAFVSAAALVFGLLMLHPYPRQSLFGPTIRGRPWCVWEEAIRRQADPNRRQWFYRMMAKVGLIQKEDFNELVHPELLPVLLFLVEEPDPQARLAAAGGLERQLNGQMKNKELEDSILPVLRRLMRDDDPTVRVRAALALWRAKDDSEMKAVALNLSQHTDLYFREIAVMNLCEMARQAPDLFEPLSILTSDANVNLRNRAVQSMRSFGTRGLPILQRAFDDTDKGVRQMAIRTAGDMAKTAEPLIPILRNLQDEGDPEIRYDIESAMHRISPEAYPRPDRPIPKTR